MKPLAEYSASECADKLREMGDKITAEKFDEFAVHDAVGDSAAFWGQRRELPPWKHVEHKFGFIGNKQDDPNFLKIVPAGTIEGDASLRKARLNLTLNRLYIAEYPGSGEHQVLVAFKAENCVGGTNIEPLQFNITVRARNGQQAAIVGWPIFSSLAPVPGRVAFECATVNVKNENDLQILKIIDSDAFRKGLDLLTSAQPAMKPLFELSTGLLRLLGERHGNVTVQKFAMGLDFGATPLGARLAEGDYIAIQAPREFEWSDLAYDKRRGELIHIGDKQIVATYNYLVFGVTRTPAHSTK